MKKLLLTLLVAVSVTLAIATGTALADPVQTPVGVLNLNASNGSLSTSTFTFGGTTVPVDPGLEASNTDNVNTWVTGAPEPDYVSLYPGYIRYQQFECARMTLDLPNVTGDITGDTGWHCAALDNPFVQDSVTGTAVATPALSTVAFDGNGLTTRAPDNSGVSVPPLDLSPYAGLILKGLVYSNVCSQIYLDPNYTSTPGPGGVNNMTGCIGSADQILVGATGRALATTSSCDTSSGHAVCKPTGVQTKISLRIPGGCVIPRHLRGKTIAKARRMLVQHNCRLGKITRKHSQVKKGRVIKAQMKVGSVHRVNTRVPLLVSRGR